MTNTDPNIHNPMLGLVEVKPRQSLQQLQEAQAIIAQQLQQPRARLRA